jgi:hypothetical protein
MPHPNAKEPAMSDQPNKRERKDSIPSDKALLIAADPTASSEILASLAEHEDPLVRARVAANPNTPQSALKWLWRGSEPHRTSDKCAGGSDHQLEIRSWGSALENSIISPVKAPFSSH